MDRRSHCLKCRTNLPPAKGADSSTRLPPKALRGPAEGRRDGQKTRRRLQSAVNSFFFSPPRIRSRHCRSRNELDWAAAVTAATTHTSPRTRTEAFDGEIDWPECQRTNRGQGRGRLPPSLPHSTGPGPGQSTPGQPCIGTRSGGEGRGGGGEEEKMLRRGVSAFCSICCCAAPDQDQGRGRGEERWATDVACM